MCVCVYQTFLGQFSVDGHMGCFYVLAIVSNVMNIEVHVSSQARVFMFFGYMPRIGIAGSFGNSVD